jgi:hypothetical protein
MTSISINLCQKSRSKKRSEDTLEKTHIRKKKPTKLAGSDKESRDVSLKNKSCIAVFVVWKD